MKKSILKIMLGTIILEVLLVCTFILLGSFDEILGKMMLSVAVVFFYSIPCLFYARLYDNDKYKEISLCSSLVVFLAAVITILAIVEVLPGNVFFDKTLGVLRILIGGLTFISWLLYYPNVNRIFSGFKETSIGLITMVCALSIPIYIMDFLPENLFGRLYYMLIVLSSGSFICTLILSVIYKKEIKNYPNN